MTYVKYMVSILIAAVLFLLPHCASSQNAGNIDVVLVIDSSGSMQKTDPLSLRVPAAKLFISLLDKDDRAGIVSFSDRGYLLSDLLSVGSEENREKLFAAADRISADGLYTNLYEALNSGYTMLSSHKETDREKILILLSDGIMDVGSLDQDKILLDSITGSLTETLKKQAIRVYTIAFTEASDRKLLERISKRTNGFYNTALADKDLHGVFTSIFESLKSPEMVPVKGNSFVIDSSIEELTIVATKSDPDTEIQIISPSGESYSSSGKYSGIGWFVSENFDMITILKPLEGKWEILFSTGENNKAYVITDLKLQTDFDKMYAIFGEQMDVRIWLEREGARITEQQILDKIKVYIELTGPDGTSSKLEAFQKGDGIFLRSITPFTAGTYKMKFVAEGMTFSRAKSFAFNAANLEESKKDLMEQREEKKKQQEAEPPISHEEGQEEHEVSFITLFVQFIVMNIVLAMIVLGYFRRERLREFLKNIRVRDLLQQAAGLTKLIHRKRKGEEAESPADEGPELPASQTAETGDTPVPEAAPKPETPPAAPATGDQPETEAAGEEAASEAIMQQNAEGASEAEPEAGPDGDEEQLSEAEEIQTIETIPDADGSEDRDQQAVRREMIDLEEIELAEKEKQIEELLEERGQVTESQSAAGEDGPDEAGPDSADGVQSVAAAADDSDDIELTPKGGADQPGEAPDEVRPEEAAQQAETADDEPPAMEVSGSDGDDYSNNREQQDIPEEDTARPEEPVMETRDEREAAQEGPSGISDETREDSAPEGDGPASPGSADVDVFDSVMAEMEEAMKQEKPDSETDTPEPDRTAPVNNKQGEEDPAGA